MKRIRLPSATAYLASALIFLRTGGSVSGQPVELPPSLSDSTVMPLSSVDLRDQPPPDAATLALVDTILDKGDPPIGLNLKAGYDTTNSGTWENLSAGGQIWRLRVRSIGALWVRPGFGTWRIPAGSKMWVYDEAAAQIWGPYDHTNVHAHGQRWTPEVDDEVLVVELLWPAALSGLTPNLHLTRFSHGHRSPALRGDNCDCDPDTSCPEADDLSVVKRGWARLTITIDACTNDAFYQLERQCSGTFINTTANDCTQFYLTAGHCVTQPGLIASATFLFNYERPGCCSGTASIADQHMGATKTAEWDGVPGGGANDYACHPEEESGGNDMALLYVDDPIPQSYAVRFNGWSRANTPSPGAACLHMPTPGVSRKAAISLDGYIAHPTDSNFWRVPDWEFGALFGGSSGGALFNDTLRVVGWLCCGETDECPAAADDSFGRLDKAWEGGGDLSSQLKFWLDPAHTNLISYHGRDDASDFVCKFLPWPYVLSAGAGFGGGAPAPNPGDVVTLSVPIENRGSTPLTNLTGVLTSTTPGVTILESQATWPDIGGFGFAANDAPHFIVHLDPGISCGTIVDFSLALTSDAGDGQWYPPFSIRIGEGQTGAVSGFDVFTSASLTGGNSWTPDSTDDTPLGPRWFIPDVAVASDTVLVSSEVAAVPSNSRLRFRQKIDTENTYDGGMIEYSTDGTSWSDAKALIVSGGYLSGVGPGLDPALAGREAWGGDSDGWQNVELDLSSLEGMPLRFRWRFVTDDSGGDVGWWIDDAVIEHTAYTCTSAACVGDCLVDGQRNGRDIQPFVNCALGTGPLCACADFDGNGVFDLTDSSAFTLILLADVPCSP